MGNFLSASVAISRRLFLIFLGVLMVLLLFSFGFGYFFGRYEQIQLNKAVLKVVPEVNCGVLTM